MDPSITTNLTEISKCFLCIIASAFLVWIIVRKILKEREKKEIKYKKYRTYTGIVSVLENIKRHSPYLEKSRQQFIYHIKLYALAEDNSVEKRYHQYRAEQYQKIQSKHHFILLDQRDLLDKLAVDYHYFSGKDPVFDKMKWDVLSYENPHCEEFTGITETAEIENRLVVALDEINSRWVAKRENEIANLIKHAELVLGIDMANGKIQYVSEDIFLGLPADKVKIKRRRIWF